MTVLAIRNLTLRVGGRALLEGADMTLDTGRRLGLVGRNGAGKSTLLKAIIGEIQPDGGEIRMAARARLGHVAQEAPGGEGSLLDAVLAGDPAECYAGRRSCRAAFGDAVRAGRAGQPEHDLVVVDE